MNEAIVILFHIVSTSTSNDALNLNIFSMNKLSSMDGMNIPGFHSHVRYVDTMI